LHKNKYKSHEEKNRSVWLNIWGQCEKFPIGKIEINGDTDWGYRVLRRGEMFKKYNYSWPKKTYNYGWSEIIFGYADFFFTKRKDAENIALVLAMYFSGDLKDKSLLDPTIFNGRIRTQIIDRLPLSEARTELFWKGADDIDPSNGWIEIDPNNNLGKLPLDEPLPINYDEDEDGEITIRSYLISEVSDAIVEYYKKWFLTSKVELQLHEVFSLVLDEIDCGEIAVTDRGYVTLLALAKLKNNIPVGWVFPQQQDEVRKLTTRLWSNLSADVVAYVEECEVEAKHDRDHQVKICNLKAKILAQMPKFTELKNGETETRINCCVSYLFEVRDGSNEPPSHPEAEYVFLMQNFVDKASSSEKEAINWLVSRLV
jgi:hypothetical protein